jgi:hypothetical protein
MAKAKAWFNAHKSDSVMEFDCPICDAYKTLGGVEFSHRLVRAFGKDAILTALTPASATIIYSPWVVTGDNQTMTITKTSTMDQNDSTTREEEKPKDAVAPAPVVEDVIAKNKRVLAEFEKLKES